MVIRMRHNRSQTRQRRSHHALKAPTLSVCSNCKAEHRPHHMCLSCGFYNGRQVMDLVAEKAKREARLQAKHDAIRAEAGVPAEPAHDHDHDHDHSHDEEKPAKEKVRAAKAATAERTRAESESQAARGEG